MSESLKPRTKQQLFDKIVTHLFTQRKQSAKEDYTGSYACMYRAQSNGKTISCAVGCIIPDELYAPDMEYRSLQDLSRFLKENGKQKTILYKEIYRNAPLLEALQTFHDDWFPGTVKEFEKVKKDLLERAQLIAKEFKLKADALQPFM